MRRSSSLVVIVVLALAAAACGSSSPAKDSLVPSMRLGDVVAQVRHQFGDRQVISASIAGPVLSVKLAVPSNRDGPAQMKAAFEGWILGHAVADWQRLRATKPISGVNVLGSDGKSLEGYGGSSRVGHEMVSGIPVTRSPNISQLSADACRSATTPLVQGPISLVSTQTLPYARGTCVVVLRSSRVAIANPAPIVNALGSPNQRPVFFEVVNARGVPLTAWAWMVEGGGVQYTIPALDTGRLHR